MLRGSGFTRPLSFGASAYAAERFLVDKRLIQKTRWKMDRIFFDTRDQGHLYVWLCSPKEHILSMDVELSNTHEGWVS